MRTSEGAPLLLLDTNALLLPFRERFPLRSEIERVAPGREVAVPGPALRELERLAADGAPHAAGALVFARRLPILAARGAGDEGVIECARRNQAWVLTADRELARRLRSFGITVLGPRGNQRLEIYGPTPA
jgi:rRNA-processing protein FCF1